MKCYELKSTPVEKSYLFFVDGEHMSSHATEAEAVAARNLFVGKEGQQNNEWEISITEIHQILTQQTLVLIKDILLCDSCHTTLDDNNEDSIRCPTCGELVTRE